MQIAAQTDIIPIMHEVSNTVQTQSLKGAVQEQTATFIALQIQAVIQV